MDVKEKTGKLKMLTKRIFGGRGGERGGCVSHLYI